MNTTKAIIDSALLAAPSRLNIWFGSFLWIIGNVGCFGNIIVFCSPTFLKRAYSVYLLAATMANFYYFNFVLLTRILQKGFQIPIVDRFMFMCKLRQFSTVWGNVVSFSFFSFATIDRLLSAQRENKYRQWSNRTSLAYKMILVTLLFWFLLLVHRLILYRIQGGICGPPDGFYKYFDNYFQVLFSSFSPAIVMSVLAYLLIKSVRNVARRTILPINTNVPVMIPNKSMIHQMDTQLTIMLTLESIIAIITYVPYAIELAYTSATEDWYKTALELAWENVFIELIHLFSYIFFATSFYVSVLTNNGFRRQIMKFGHCHTERHFRAATPTIIGTGASIISHRY